MEEWGEPDNRSWEELQVQYRPEPDAQRTGGRRWAGPGRRGSGGRADKSSRKQGSGLSTAGTRPAHPRRGGGAGGGFLSPRCLPKGDTRTQVRMESAGTGRR